MTTSHSPTPWRLGPWKLWGYGGITLYADIYAADQKSDTTAGGIFRIFSINVGGEKPHPQHVADAELVIRLVNQHADQPKKE